MTNGEFDDEAQNEMTKKFLFTPEIDGARQFSIVSVTFI
jgi:hypothetical protein